MPNENKTGEKEIDVLKKHHLKHESGEGSNKKLINKKRHALIYDKIIILVIQKTNLVTSRNEFLINKIGLDSCLFNGRLN